jgi:high-affinity nickel permease
LWRISKSSHARATGCPATIDGLTRLNQRRGLPLARYCGALFSAGHGVVVLAIAAVVGSLSQHWVPPDWLSTSAPCWPRLSP